MKPEYLNCQKSDMRTNNPCCSVLLWTSFCFLHSACFNQQMEWFLMIQHTLNRSANLFSTNHPTLCFWFRREGRQRPNDKQLLSQTEKSSHWRFFIKKLFLKIFAILTGKHLCGFFKNTYFEEHLHMAASELTLWSDCLELRFWSVFKMILTQ